MVKVIKIANWLCLVLGLIGYAGLYRLNQKYTSPVQLLIIIPYVLTLLCFLRYTRNYHLWITLIINVVYSIIYIGLLLLGFSGQVASPLFIVIWALFYGITPLTLNTWYIYKYRINQSANKSSQPTPKSGAAEL